MLWDIAKNTKMTLFGLLEYLCVPETLATVQVNSNLTLACMSLAETRLIFKFARDLVASA